METKTETQEAEQKLINAFPHNAMKEHKKLIHKLEDRRTITIQAWTRTSNSRVVQVFIGNVLIRQWTFVSAYDAIMKMNYLIEVLESNHRVNVFWSGITKEKAMEK